MAKIRLRPGLPHGDANGLQHYADEFVKLRPGQTKLALVLLDSKGTFNDNDTAESLAHARILRIEVINRKDDVKEIQRVMLRANEERTGRVTLPFETERAIEDVFADFVAEAQDPDERDTE